MPTRRWIFPVILSFILLSLPLLLLVAAVMLTYPKLPSLEVLTDYQPKIPLRIYSAEGILLGEFGEERRIPVKIADVPKVMKNAILAAEDERFYQHDGVDYMGVLRAAIANFTSSDTEQGASTITMQVARNFFLSREKTYTRKFNEMLLAFKIERYLSKDDILQLYINQIYLGQRAYGFAAASQSYFGKSLDQISTAEAAMLAGLPKAPSSNNPVVNPKRAKLRQMYVLQRMLKLHFIDSSQFKLSQSQSLDIKRGNPSFPVKADYLNEMVRQAVYEKYLGYAYTQGLKVYTTIRLKDQLAAYDAVRKGVLEYDRRHGYRGPERLIDLSQNSSEELLEKALQDSTDNDDLLPAVVLAVSAAQIEAYCKGVGRITIDGKALHFARGALNGKAGASQRIVAGSVIRVQKDNQDIWQITQLPEVESAFVSGNPRDGAIYALVGGFDFNHNQFNHVTQAWRQPGSSFKPFIYSAALEKGFTPETIINDAPLSVESNQRGGDPWQPKNYGGKFEGPMSLHQALVKSKNMVSIRILQAITPYYAQNYITKFGFLAEKHPPYLSMALGAGSVTPLQMLTGYSVFANGGFHVHPYFIEHIEDDQNNKLSESFPFVANLNAERIIDERNANTMVSMMKDVVRYGTAVRAMELNRHDLAGKTGTTSDSVDVWFCGFNPAVVGIAWMGFDQPHSLGSTETGGSTALPIWMSYMKKVLKSVP